jgi:hypothetical protein
VRHQIRHERGTAVSLVVGRGVRCNVMHASAGVDTAVEPSSAIGIVWKVGIRTLLNHVKLKQQSQIFGVKTYTQRISFSPSSISTVELCGHYIVCIQRKRRGKKRAARNADSTLPPPKRGRTSKPAGLQIGLDVGRILPWKKTAELRRAKRLAGKATDGDGDDDDDEKDEEEEDEDEDEEEEE